MVLFFQNFRNFSIIRAAQNNNKSPFLVFFELFFPQEFLFTTPWPSFGPAAGLPWAVEGGQPLQRAVKAARFPAKLNDQGTVGPPLERICPDAAMSLIHVGPG